MFGSIIKGILITFVITIIVGLIVAAATLIDFFVLDHFLSEQSDYKICDVNGCKYVSTVQERDCFENGIRINCSQIPIMEGYP